MEGLYFMDMSSNDIGVDLSRFIITIAAICEFFVYFRSSLVCSIDGPISHGNNPDGLRVQRYVVQ